MEYGCTDLACPGEVIGRWVACGVTYNLLAAISVVAPNGVAFTSHVIAGAVNLACAWVHSNRGAGS